MAAVGLLLQSGVALAQTEEAPAKIGRIDIRRANVFDPSIPSESWWLFQAANKLHLTTQPQVIRRELLFREDAPLNPALIEETERNLRRLEFFRRVEISVSTAAAGTHGVNVKTQDAWTLEPQVDYSRLGGHNAWEAGLVDRNFLGLGKTLSAFYHHAPGQNTTAVFYHDKQFLGKHLDFTAGVDVDRDFRQYGISLQKPFYATITPFSAGGSAFIRDQNLPLFTNGTQIGRFRKIRREATLSYGQSLSPSVSLTRQTTLTLRRTRDNFETINGSPAELLPAEEDTGAIEITGSWQKIDFIKERHIQKFDRDEDFNLGSGVSWRLGLAPTWLGSTSNQLLPLLSGRTGRSWGPGHFAFIESKADSEITKDRTKNFVWSTKAQHYYQGFHRQTVTVHLDYAHGYRLDQDHLLSLGEDSGLRGYPIAQFAGDRRLLVNLEDRIFFIDDLFHLMSLGGVMFLDTGNAWTANQEFGGIFKLKSAAGFGFKIAASRSTRNEPISINFAYALNDNGRSSRFVISVTSGFHFGEPISFGGAP